MPTQREEIDEILVDAFGEYEQMSAWEVAFTEDVEVPFQATLLGVPVEVHGFRANDDNHLQCEVTRDQKRRWIGVEDLDLEPLPGDCGRLLGLYLAWKEGNY